LPDIRRDEYAQRFGLRFYNPYRGLPCKLLDQLDACSCDEARRLILGVSEPF
jgi:hypothetical protein